MYSNKFVIIVVLAAMTGSINCSVLPALAPAVHAVPAVAPVAYHHAVPYNIPPYSDRVDIQNRVLSVPAVHAVPAAVPAVHAAPAVHAVPAHVHAAVPAVGYAAGPFAAPVAPYALPHHAHLAYAHAGVPAAYPAPIAAPAAYAYGHPAVGAPVWRR